MIHPGVSKHNACFHLTEDIIGKRVIIRPDLLLLRVIKSGYIKFNDPMNVVYN